MNCFFLCGNAVEVFQPENDLYLIFETLLNYICCVIVYKAKTENKCAVYAFNICALIICAAFWHFCWDYVKICMLTQHLENKSPFNNLIFIVRLSLRPMIMSFSSYAICIKHGSSMSVVSN